jgi:hypothetical protein
VEDETKDIPTQITFSLAWDGFASALDFLFGFTESLDLLFNPQKVIDTRELGLGDFGVGWLWVPGELNVLVFVRNNVFVGLQGFLPSETMFSIARFIDEGLLELSQANPYQVDEQGFFAENLGKTSKIQVPVGGRLDMGIQRPDAETFFFVTSTGSTNRDPASPGLWYFRAGQEVGDFEVTLLRVDDGILPHKETRQIQVVSG